MNPTSVSLLERLKEAGPEALDWGRFHDLYRPLIQRWIGRVPGTMQHVEDLTQDVMEVLVREVPRFERQRLGSFRAWLRQVTANRIRQSRRRWQRMPIVATDRTNLFLDQIADSNSLLARELDGEHDRHVCDTLLAAVEADFEPETWRAFRMFALEGRPAADVARELSPMTVNAVIKAKARVLKRLREEAGGLLD